MGGSVLVGTTGRPSGMQDSPAGFKFEHRCSS